MSKSWAHEIVKKPIIICDYNENMAGVDKTDQLMVYYACGRKSLKWYKRIFWRIFDNSILNAYVLFKFLINPGQKKIYSETFLNGACLYSHSTNFISMTWARLLVTCSWWIWSLEGKTFSLLSWKKEWCIVCGYKKIGPYSKSRKDAKPKLLSKMWNTYVPWNMFWKMWHPSQVLI